VQQSVSDERIRIQGMRNKALDSRSAWQFGLATVFVTAAVGYFGNGLTPVWWLTWLAPLPALVLAPRVSKTQAFAVASLGWALGGFTWFTYLHRVLELPVGVFALAVVTPPAIVFGLGVLIARTFLLRGSLWRAALAFPSVWVSYEYLNAIASPHSTFGSLAYTQMNFLPILQVASITGVWGIVFLMFLLPSSIAALLTYSPRDGKWNSFTGAIALVFVAVLALGSYRLSFTPARTEQISIGLMASDARDNRGEPDGEKGMRILHSYADQIGSLAAQGAQTIVLPEKIATVADADLPQMDHLFQSAATDNHVNILVGIDHREANGYLNEARLYQSGGGPVTVYIKHHLVPGFESRDRPGSEFSIISAGPFVEALAVCKDMDFPQLSRHYGRSDVALLLVPAWDFDADRWLHGRMAVMRGVEEGFTIARSAKQGLLTISDYRGRILAERRSEVSPFASFVVKVPVYRTTTIYSRLGDWFAWINLMLLIALIVSATARKSVFAKANSAA
jgi:apolipoprotein N-acyltransferase